MSKLGLNEVLKKVERTKRELPKRLANMTQNYFVLSWSNQGFDNRKWVEVNRRTPGTPEFKYPEHKGLSRRTKPILVQSGELRRRVANSVITARWDKIYLMVDLPYAAAHNDGDGNIPKRQYVGQTQELTGKQIGMIENFFSRIW